MAVRTELTVRATTSNKICFQLLAGTAPIDLTSIGTVYMFLKDNAGGTTGYSNLGAGAKITVDNAAQGSVGFTPGTADLVAGSAPYQGYFKLFESATAQYFLPEDSEFTIHCRETF